MDNVIPIPREIRVIPRPALETIGVGVDGDGMVLIVWRDGGAFDCALPMPREEAKRLTALLLRELGPIRPASDDETAERFSRDRRRRDPDTP